MNPKFNIPETEWHDLKRKYPRGTVIQTTIVKKIAPSLIVVHFVNSKYALLPLSNLAWNLPQSEALFNELQEDDDLRVIISEYKDESKTVILSIKELSPIAKETIVWRDNCLGEKLSGELIEVLHTKAIVAFEKQVFGIVDCSPGEYTNEDIGNEFEFLVIGKNEEDHFIKLRSLTEYETVGNDFSEIVLNEDRTFADFDVVDKNLESFDRFWDSNLRGLTNKSDIERLKEYFSVDDKLFSKALSLPNSLCLKFKYNHVSWQTFTNQFLPYLGDTVDEKEGLRILENQYYWCNLSFNNSNEISLFNDEVLIKALVNKSDGYCQILVTDFIFGKKNEWGGREKEKKQKQGAFLLQSKLRVLTPLEYYSIDKTQEENHRQLDNKTQAFFIYQELIKKQGAILKEEGLALEIFDKFLEYQINKNNRDNQKYETRIEGNQFERTFTQSDDGICLELDDSVPMLESASSEEDKVVKVSIDGDKDDEREYVSHASYHILDDSAFLTFTDGVQVGLLAKGFYILPVVSNKQFRVQRDIIREFFSKELKLEHIENLLLKPQKIKPPIPDYFEFINPRLRETEENLPENNQVAAVRKSVGNNNIFLIQGPPGTGKTTVIAEVIQQLVNKGKKVLVSSQTHVAVDNVLEKLSELDEMCLLRVGSYEKLTNKLKRFHIKGWRKYYEEDYQKFLSNNLKLLDLVLKNKDSFREIDLKQFRKEAVGNFVPDYHDNLKDSFRNKHHDFLNTIMKFNKSSIYELGNILSEWQKNINEEEDVCDALVYNSINVALGTCIGLKTDVGFTKNAPKFDTVIIDEAGKANLSETFVPISMAKKVLLVGDQRQLPPYFDDSSIDKNEKDSFPNSRYGNKFLEKDIKHALKTSFFEFLVNKSKDKEFPDSNIELLNYQHRMHPSIGEFVSKAFYDGKLRMGDSTHLNKLELESPFNREIVFFDTSTSKNPFEIANGMSFQNKTEAVYVANHILPRLLQSGVKPEQIAVIAPYKSQVSLINNLVRANKDLGSANVEISTLDSFQGMEFDIIIFSFTRSASRNQEKKRVGFLDDARRLNVAFSRAKKKLVLVGNSTTLTDKRSHNDYMFDYTGLFNNLVELSKNRNIGNFVSITDFTDESASFKKFIENYKQGDEVKCIYKRSHGTGHFFNLEDKLDGRMHDPQSLHSFEAGKEYELLIKKVEYKKKLVELTVKRTDFNYSRKELVWFKFKTKIKSGYIFTNNIQDLYVHDAKHSKSIEKELLYPIIIEKVDKENYRLSGRLLDVGSIIGGVVKKITNSKLTIKLGGVVIVLNKTFTTRVKFGSYVRLKLKEINNNSKELSVELV